MKLFRATFLLFAVSGLLTFQPSCSSRSQVQTFRIGQKVLVGKLFYQVMEAQWMGEVQGARQPPKNRILQLHLSVTNSGPREAALPFLRLIDAGGNEIQELSELEDNPRWLGILRRMQPALTEDGLVFFDVPIGDYKLEVVDNTNPDDEKAAYIEIPASLAPPAQPPDAKGI